MSFWERLIQLHRLSQTSGTLSGAAHVVSISIHNSSVIHDASYNPLYVSKKLITLNGKPRTKIRLNFSEMLIPKDR